MAPRAVLMGMPGSGKSTIGRRLAKALGVPLLDTDAKIVETTGRTIADIFSDGEQEFRRIEEDVVRAALAEHDGIVSLGGGAITSLGVREALAGHTVIFSRSARPKASGAPPAAPCDRYWPAATPPREPRADGAAGSAVSAGRHDSGQHQSPQPRGGGPPHRRASRESRGARPAPTPSTPVVAPRPVQADTAAQHRGPTHPAALAARNAERTHD